MNLLKTLFAKVSKPDLINTGASMATLAIVLGLVACVVYHSEPDTVRMASSVAILGWSIRRALGFYQNSMFSQLFALEGKEHDMLNRIRSLVDKEGGVVSDELMSASKQATKDVDELFISIHGFARPRSIVRLGPLNTLFTEQVESDTDPR